MKVLYNAVYWNLILVLLYFDMISSNSAVLNIKDLFMQKINLRFYFLR